MRKNKSSIGICGNGRAALLKLTKKYMEVTNESCRSKTAKLRVNDMMDVQDPNKYFIRATMRRSQVEQMDKHILGRRFKDILVQGLTTDKER